MYRTILEIRYQFHTRSFWITVLLSVVAFMEAALIEWYGDLIYLYKISMSYGVFVVAAPCIAVLPNVKILSSYKGNVMKYNLTRSGKRTYFNSRAFVVSFTGGLALMLGPVISLLLLSFKFPMASDVYRDLYELEPALNGSFHTLMNNHQFVAFFASKLLMVFLYGFSVNQIAFAISTLAQDSFVIVFAPFIILQGMSLWLNKGSIFFQPAMYLHGNVINLPFDDTFGFLAFVLCVHIVLWIVCLFIAHNVLKRRLEYA